jgi:hypothetical protein
MKLDATGSGDEEFIARLNLALEQFEAPSVSPPVLGVMKTIIEALDLSVIESADSEAFWIEMNDRPVCVLFHDGDRWRARSGY